MRTEYQYETKNFNACSRPDKNHSRHSSRQKTHRCENNRPSRQQQQKSSDFHPKVHFCSRVRVERSEVYSKLQTISNESGEISGGLMTTRLRKSSFPCIFPAATSLVTRSFSRPVIF